VSPSLLGALNLSQYYSPDRNAKGQFEFQKKNIAFQREREREEEKKRKRQKKQVLY